MKSSIVTRSQLRKAPKALLLCIPPELRLQIYKYLFPANTKFLFVDGTPIRQWPPFPGFGLISTCKQLHTEVEDYFYGHNTLRFKITDMLFFADRKFKKVVGIDTTGNPRILSPLTLNTARRVRSLELDVSLGVGSFDFLLSVRKQFRLFVRLISENGKPISLRSVSISIRLAWPSAQLLSIEHTQISDWIYHIGFASIEPLAGLYGLEQVEIRGNVQPELKNKLKYVMTREEWEAIPVSRMFDRSHPWKSVWEGNFENLALGWAAVKEL